MKLNTPQLVGLSDLGKLSVYDRPRTYRYILLALAVGLSVRLTYVFLLPNAIDLWRDGNAYDNIARNLISGVGYWDTTGEWPDEPPYADPSAPTARWLPGYPLFVAAVYLIAGESYRAVYITQALLCFAIAGFTYLCARQVLDRRAAIVALFLYALDPFSIYICGRFQTEQLFTFFVVSSAYFFLKAEEAGRRSVFFFGLMAAAGTLTRAVGGMMFLGLCLAALFGFGQGFGKDRLSGRLRKLSIASAVFILTLAPWLIRNHAVTGHFVFTTQSWQSLSMANNDSGGLYFTYEGLRALPKTNIQQSEIEREEIYKTFLINWISAHPWRFAELSLLRMAAFRLPTTHNVTGGRAMLAIAFSLSLYVFALIYMIAYRKDWPKVFPFFLAFGTFTALYGISLVTTRFRLPLYPFIEILAAGGMVYVFSMICNIYSSWRPREIQDGNQRHRLITTGKLKNPFKSPA